MSAGSGMYYQVASISHVRFDVRRFTAYANTQQTAVEFVDAIRLNVPRLIFTDQGQDELVEVQPGAVMLPLAAAEGLARYAKIQVEEYALALSMAGILMHQTLLRHEHFKIEDLLHRNDPSCIFSRGLAAEKRVVMLEHLYVCNGCRKFYAKLELGDLCNAAYGVARRIDESRMQRSVRRRIAQKPLA